MIKQMHLLFLDTYLEANNGFVMEDSLTLTMTLLIGSFFLRSHIFSLVSSLVEVGYGCAKVGGILFFFFTEIQNLQGTFMLYLWALVILASFTEDLLDRLSDFGHILYFVLSLLASGLISYSGNLFVITFFFELIFLCVVCPLFLIYRDERIYNLAMGYFLINLVSSTLFTFGGQLTYVSTLSLNFIDAYSYTQEHSEVLNVQVSFLFLIFALLVKLAVVPFHRWGLVIYAHVPFGLLANLWGVVKLLYWFVILMLLWYYEMLFFSDFKSFIGFSFLCGGVVAYCSSSAYAFQESNLGIFLLYSSSIYAGLFLIFLSFGDAWIYSVTDIFLFVYVLCIVSLLLYLEFGDFHVVSFSDLININVRSAAVVLILCLYFVGLPPFVSFFFKYVSYSYLFSASGFVGILAGVVLVIILITVWSTQFYFRFVSWLRFI